MERNFDLENRDYYLKRLISYKDTEPIKVITGFRRCGKSSLLQLLRNHLLSEGVHKNQIVYISFEILEFRSMTYLELYENVKKQVLPDEKMYLIFDEVQVIDHWEDTVNSLHTEIDADIYISGSNAKLLSSDLSTYLSGRYVELPMQPLSFAEFIRFHGYKLESYLSPLGGQGFRVKDKNEEAIPLEEVFLAYLNFGGMPGIREFGFDRDKIWTLVDDIYNTVVVRDIIEHENEKRAGERKANDPVLLKKIAGFMADSIGSTISLNTISNTLVTSKGLEDRSKQGKPAVATVQAYVKALTDCFLFYPVDRYDIKDKEYLKTQKKYYIVDPELRSYLLGYRGTDRGRLIENVVFLELKRRGYKISVGKVGNTEVDFVAESQKEKVYIQVTEEMSNPDTAARELTPLRKIRDNFRKVVIAERAGSSLTEDGIEIIKLLDFLLEDAN